MPDELAGFVEAREIAALVAEQLARRSLKLVLAESCTAGLTAALLGTVPGISSWFCGSAVTYREAVKVAWLGLDADTLQEVTAVSEYASAEMARGVLQRTDEANISAAITGHLGPDAPPSIDGVCFIAVALRTPSLPAADQTNIRWLHQSRVQLVTTTRMLRQHEAAQRMLEAVLTSMQSM